MCMCYYMCQYFVEFKFVLQRNLFYNIFLRNICGKPPKTIKVNVYCPIKYSVSVWVKCEYLYSTPSVRKVHP